jgi:hypothetical protein
MEADFRRLARRNEYLVARQGKIINRLLGKLMITGKVRSKEGVVPVVLAWKEDVLYWRDFRGNRGA